jgi:hypothetical protein
LNKLETKELNYVSQLKEKDSILKKVREKNEFLDAKLKIKEIELSSLR